VLSGDGFFFFDTETSFQTLFILSYILQILLLILRNCTSDLHRACYWSLQWKFL